MRTLNMSFRVIFMASWGTEVSRRMHIRKAPRFVFVKDEGAAYAAHINKLLGELDIEPDSDAE